MKDVHNTKELIVGLATLVKVAKEAKENDGKVNVLDFPLLMKVVPAVGPMFTDIGEVPAEIKDADESEIKELLAEVGAAVGGVITKAELIEQIEAGLEVVQALAKFASKLKH